MYTLTIESRELNYKEPIESLDYIEDEFSICLKLYNQVFNLQFTKTTFLYDNIIEALRDLLSNQYFENYNCDFEVLLDLCNFLTADQKNHYRLKYGLIDRIPDPKYKPIDLEDILYEAKKLESLRRY